MRPSIFHPHYTNLSAEQVTIFTSPVDFVTPSFHLMRLEFSKALRLLQDEVLVVDTLVISARRLGRLRRSLD